MCGRYTIIATAREIEKRFNVAVPEIYTPRYNAAPTQILPVITSDSPEGVSFFRWGLLSTWAKDIKSMQPLINARAESLAEKSTFRHLLASKRCLVLSDGFYEWKQVTRKIKIPYRIQLKTGNLFAYAGLWDTYRSADESVVHTFTIITSPANEAISPLHDRMPVILPPEAESVWLDNQFSVSEHLQLLLPLSSQKTRCFTVSNLVNSVKNDDPRLIEHQPSMDQNGNFTLFS